MKKKRVLSILVLLLVVGIGGILVVETYAKYTSTVSKSGSFSVAKWAFDSDNPNGELNISLNGTVDETTLKEYDSNGNRLIAPGTSGKFRLVLSNNNSEVGVNFDISFKDSENLPANLVLRQDSKIIESGGSLKGQIKPGQTLEIPMEWYWKYSNNDDDDIEDTNDGIAANTLNLTATIKATQAQPGSIITTGLTN